LQYVTPAGWYLAQARSGLADIWTTPVVDAGASVFDLDLRYEPGGARLDGMLLHADGTAVPNGFFCFASEDAARRAQPGGAACQRTAPDATYRSSWLSPGTWRLWGFPKRPAERPASDEFAARYGAQAQKVEVKPETARLRVNLRTIE
jgi:hypothetical protein